MVTGTWVKIELLSLRQNSKNWSSYEFFNILNENRYRCRDTDEALIFNRYVPILRMGRGLEKSLFVIYL